MGLPLCWTELCTFVCPCQRLRRCLTPPYQNKPRTLLQVLPSLHGRLAVMDALLLLAEVAEGTGQLVDKLLSLLHSAKGSGAALPVRDAPSGPQQQQPAGDTGPMINQLLHSCMRLLQGALRDVLSLWADLPVHYFTDGSRVHPDDGDDHDSVGRSPQLILQDQMLEVSRALLSAGRASQKAALQAGRRDHCPHGPQNLAAVRTDLRPVPSILLVAGASSGAVSWLGDLHDLLPTCPQGWGSRGR